ncbi:MAG: hypothetical protein GVY26_11885 [Bacteroidetes bacterium]|jgi:hypothetical protein|nr:hypothetical protein [Bacteroidota bacterium]
MTAKTDRLNLIALIASTKDEQLIAELNKTVEQRLVLQRVAEPTREYISVDALVAEQSYNSKDVRSLRGSLPMDEEEFLVSLKLLD